MIHPPTPANNYHQHHVLILLENLRRWTGRDLISEYGFSQAKLGEQVFNADFYLLSHTHATEPILNYSNQRGLDLWELTWPELISMPSIKTAKPVDRQERADLLAKVTAHNYYDNYRGIRVSKTGKEFYICNGTIWNLFTDTNQPYGQAAWFDRVEPIDPDVRVG